MRDSKRDTDVWNRLLDSEGQGEGEGRMIWENGIETCILSGKKQITSLGLIQDTRCSSFELDLLYLFNFGAILL